MTFLRKWREANNPIVPSPEPASENDYGRQLTAGQIATGEHRQFVGGMWQEIGLLQFEFLKRAGLAPNHRLIDIGCGCLRGGVYFVPYLDKQRYYGIDLNASLIAAGHKELRAAGCLDREASLYVTDKFDMAHFGVQFDFALAVSVFTHLYANHIGLCLKNVSEVLAPDGKFFATFFQAPEPLHVPPITHPPSDIVTHCDHDPFHYAPEEMASLASFAGLSMKLIGEWGHPRQQQMLCFSRK